MAKMNTQEYMLWRTWRFDREKFRQLGVWGGDENGEIGQGTYMLSQSLAVAICLQFTPRLH